MTLLDRPELFTSIHSRDARGDFSKPFHDGLPEIADFRIRELYWTTSSRGVVRGMHFQVPPATLGKLVWLSKGTVVDVVVDLRVGPTYGTSMRYDLDSNSGQCVWVPAGFAHGFQALEDDTIVNYAVDHVFDPAADGGVRWDSVGIDWPLPAGAISDRDRALPSLAEFDSPFTVN